MIYRADSVKTKNGGPLENGQFGKIKKLRKLTRGLSGRDRYPPAFAQRLQMWLICSVRPTRGRATRWAGRNRPDRSKPVILTSLQNWMCAESSVRPVRQGPLEGGGYHTVYCILGSLQKIWILRDARMVHASDGNVSSKTLHSSRTYVLVPIFHEIFQEGTWKTVKLKTAWGRLNIHITALVERNILKRKHQEIGICNIRNRKYLKIFWY